MFRILATVLALCVLTAPASAQQQQLQNVEKSTSGDWSLQCGTLPSGGQRLCQMSQVVNNPKDGKPLLQALVFRPPGDKAAVMRLIAPLGVWLRPGIGFSIDGGSKNNLKYEFCLSAGCIAQIKLSSGLVSALKRGSKARLNIHTIRRQKLNLSVSLRGFTAAFDGMR
jgi:invasion protein IalB